MFTSIDNQPMIWDCKDCHKAVPDDQTVAYQLINGILYGWCESCFRSRSMPVKIGKDQRALTPVLPQTA